jgi:hypothetical protein
MSTDWQKVSKLKGTAVRVRNLTEQQKRQMFTLMNKYYEAVEWPIFTRDLEEKSKAILLRTEDGKIRGFSTLRRIEVSLRGQFYGGMFSGDTVVEREFWGTRVLGRVFLRELFFEKLKAPWKPLYWLLMSKGYKTYLLMANNFRTHFPRFEKDTPDNFLKLQRAFYTELYPHNFDERTGLIHFDRGSMRLKSAIAPISEDLLAISRIEFFERRNPDWAQGTELACMAEMTLTMPFYYACKSLWKTTALGKYWRRLRPGLKAQVKEAKT